MVAEVGERAPDFALPSTEGRTITLAEYRGTKHLVLSFHVLDFTGNAEAG